jgi:sulfate-transporting ATPase
VQEQRRSKFLDRELEWIRMNPKARTTKNKARLKNYDKMLETEVEETDDSIELHIPAGKRLGDTVIRFEKVNFAYDRGTSRRREPVVRDAAGRHPRHRRPERHRQDHLPEDDHRQAEAAERARSSVGQTVELCHVDQERESLDPAKTRCGRRSAKART